MMKKVKFIWVFVICVYAGVHSTRGQAPGWSVNASDFQYSMNITGAYIVNCEFAGQLEDTVAAFVGGQLRGVAPVSEMINDRPIVFLTVFSNTPSGEEVTFRYYDKASEEVSELNVTTGFLEGKILGGRSNPFQLYEEEPLFTVVLASENNQIFVTETHTAYDAYTWYRNGEPLTGENESSLMPQTSGEYRVEILTKGGCSALSNSMTVEIAQPLNTEEALLDKAKLFPVPFSGSFFVHLPAKHNGLFKLVVHDLSGKTVLNIELDGHQTRHEIHQLASAPSGVYLIKLALDGVVKTYRIRKQ